MTTEQLKNWIKTTDKDFAECIQLGGVDGNKDRFLGVYPGSGSGRSRMALGGPAYSSYDTLQARLLLRWGKAQPAAEAKARAVWDLFYGLTGTNMDGASVICVDPGAAPVPIGKDANGVFEYVINLTITYKKEA